MASVTGKPKPSWWLISVITVLVRCKALTISAFTSRSSIGIAATCTRSASDGGSTAWASSTCANTRAASEGCPLWGASCGSPLALLTTRVVCRLLLSKAGPTSSKCTSSASNSRSAAKASISCTLPLSADQRETCVTTRAPWGTGPPASITPSSFSITPGRPSSRMKGTASKGATPSKIPAKRTIDKDSSKSKTRFFGESGTIEGAITSQLSGGANGGRYTSRVNTMRLAQSR